jgi:excisionase family DNA binding protein
MFGVIPEATPRGFKMARTDHRVLPDNLLTTAEVAALLRVSARHVQQLRHDGALRAITLGRRVYFDPRDIEDYAQSKWSA